MGESDPETSSSLARSKVDISSNRIRMHSMFEMPRMLLSASSALVRIDSSSRRTLLTARARTPISTFSPPALVVRAETLMLAMPAIPEERFPGLSFSITDWRIAMRPPSRASNSRTRLPPGKKEGVNGEPYRRHNGEAPDGDLRRHRHNARGAHVSLLRKPPRQMEDHPADADQQEQQPVRIP